MKKILKTIFTSLGIIIFIFCITGEINGIGRFACILFATIFCVVGSVIQSK